MLWLACGNWQITRIAKEGSRQLFASTWNAVRDTQAQKLPAIYVEDFRGSLDRVLKNRTTDVQPTNCPPLFDQVHADAEEYWTAVNSPVPDQMAR